MSQPAGKEPVLHAVAFLLMGLMFLDLMGVMVKFLLPRHTAFELSAYRNVIGILPSLLFLWLGGELANPRRMAIRQWRLGLLRGLSVTVAQLLYYFALGSMAFAAVSALAYTMSLFMVAFSVLVLGQRVGATRWFAVALGFGGALLIIRPGSDTFTWYAVFPLGAAALYALASITARLFDDDVSNPVIYCYSAASASVCSLALALLSGGFSPVQDFQDALMILALGLFGGVGVLCLMVAVREVAPATISPFNYFGLLIAMSYGWLFFGEAPFAQLFPGALLIVGAGLVIFWRERRL